MLRVYDTSTQSAARQFDYWRDELCHNFVELAPDRPNRHGAFNGRIIQQNLDTITISRVTAEGHCVNRTRNEINRSSENCYFANLQLVGRGRTRQNGLEIVSRPGDLVLVNACHPYDITHDEIFDLISIKVPYRIISNRLELKRATLLPHVTSSSGYGPVLRSYTMSILNEMDTESIDSSPFLAESLVGLIVSALNSAEGSSRSLGYQQNSRLQAILGYLKLNLNDPTLALPNVAEHFGLSPRYLQKLFAATGTTFSRTVMVWRLDQVASVLRSSEAAGKTLTEQAFSVGFNDFSYFSRAFKLRFGLAPRDYRRNQI